MHWHLSYQADPHALQIADRHYSPRSVGAAGFMPPGRQLVLTTPTAVWGTSYPFAEYATSQWPKAMLCTMFRNEGNVLSSELVRDALAACRWKWPELPEDGMVTFIDRDRTRPKPHPGFCFRNAGFEPCGETKSGLLALRILPDDFPPATAPHGAMETLL